ncbi:MAG: 2-C-methyl-D-erythritol 4-phosphate cytidylyltransferase [Candidatus Eremiobacteraeota bacterium]|nr:2-C-methyl-D-erythritol 4-phosphate cytidylyltransferase [Candidatus Eremiobacteraeota bacterium]
MSPTFCAVIVAAGRGVRFGRAKQLVEIAGRPLVAWSLSTFDAMPELCDLVVACEPGVCLRMQALASEFAPRLRTAIVAGGATRQESVERALAAIPSGCDAVFIHDGARPLVSSQDVRAGIAATAPRVAALLAAPVVDTIKLVPRGERTVSGTLERADLWAAQTPQFAMLADLREAHARARREHFSATDDAALLERAGCTVVVVPASSENFKVTVESDRERAEAILRARVALAQ